MQLRCRVSSPGATSAPSTEQKHRLFAEQVPKPPRHFQPHAPAPGIERYRLLDLGSRDLTEQAKILDAAKVDVRRFVPRIGKLFRARHVAPESNLPPDAPMAEIGKRDDRVPPDPQHVFEHDS